MANKRAMELTIGRMAENGKALGSMVNNMVLATNTSKMASKRKDSGTKVSTRFGCEMKSSLTPLKLEPDKTCYSSS